MRLVCISHGRITCLTDTTEFTEPRGKVLRVGERASRPCVRQSGGDHRAGNLRVLQNAQAVSIPCCIVLRP